MDTHRVDDEPKILRQASVATRTATPEVSSVAPAVARDHLTRGRRSDTRQRIQDVALNLFAEQGYEKTSLREIADHLGVTKAALYYHFKTKEDILISIVEDIGRPFDEVIEWAKTQPHTLETRRELVSRYCEAVTDAAGCVHRIFQENQATVRDLGIAEHFKTRWQTLMSLLTDDDASLPNTLRGNLALFAIHGMMFLLQNSDAPIEEKRAAAREVALDLIEQANRG